MTNSSPYTALDLLDKLIDFTTMTKDSAEWSFEKQKENPPRLVRLQQIQALMEALVPVLASSEDICRSIEDFFSSDYNFRLPRLSQSKVLLF